jgi:hypothetical protein
LEELRICSENGAVYLIGFLPNEAKRQILPEILEDTMGLPEVVDELVMDRLLWQRKERAPGEKEPGEVMEGGFPVEEEKRDAYTSRTSGIPMSPPDELIPEEEKEG